MRTLSLVSLLLLSVPALAGTSLDAYDAHAGGLNASGVSSLPLLRVGTDHRTFVRVKVSDTREALFVVALGSPTIAVSPDLASELKLKVKSGNKRVLNLKGKDNKFKLGGEVKHTTLPTLSVGATSLTDVTVVVDDSIEDAEGLPVEGVLGLSTFGDTLAWAILPSEGVLKVAPAAQGGALVAAVGAPVPFQSFPRERVKAKVREYKLDDLVGGQNLVITGSIGGTSAPIALEGYRPTCALAASVYLPGAPTAPNGDQPHVWTAVTLPGVDARPTWWTREGSYDRSLVPHNISAITCVDAMFDVDVAVDPVAHTVGLKRAPEARRQDVQAELIEAARKKASGEGAPAAEADKKDKASPAKKDPAPLQALAAAQSGAGDYAGAIQSWQAVLVLDPKACDSWQALGVAQAHAEHLTDAAASFAKADDLYHAWWDQPVDEREKLSKKYKKLKTDAEKDAFGKVPQPSACFTAAAQRAGTALALGDFGQVQSIFSEHLDLDPGVALARGLAALAVGDNAGAQGPLREALRREAVGHPEDSTRLALGLASAQAGNWAQAAPLFQRALEINDQDPMAVHLYLDALRAAQGGPAALTAATAWADARPDSFAAQLGLLREAQLSGDARAVDATTQRIEKLRAAPLWRGEVSSQDAMVARYLELVGRNDEAKTAAESALKRDSWNPLAALVLSDLAAQSGDRLKADEWLARAARMGAMHPAYAVLLGLMPTTPAGKGG